MHGRSWHFQDFIYRSIYDSVYAERRDEPLMKIPFMNGHYLDLGWGNYVILIIAVLNMNGTNFTDGIDGQLSTVTIPVAIFFTVASLMTKNGLNLSHALLSADSWDFYV